MVRTAQKVNDLAAEGEAMTDALGAVLEVAEREGTVSWADVSDDLSSGQWGRLIETGLLVDADGEGFVLDDPEGVREALEESDPSAVDDDEEVEWTTWDKLAALGAVGMFAGYSMQEVRAAVGGVIDVVMGPLADALPFYADRDDEGSYRDRVADADGREDSLRGAIYEAAVALEPMDALGDPDHPVIGATYGTFSRTRLRGVADARPEWRALINAACAFVGDDPIGTGGDPDPVTTVATLGREPDQAPITSGTSEQAATASD